MRLKKLSFVLLLSILFLVPSSSGSPIYEDFTTYTEVEPDDRIQKTVTHIDAVLRRDEDSYLYDDKGENYFEDFEHWIDFKLVSSQISSIGVVYMLSNDIDDVRGLYLAAKTFIYVDVFETASLYKISIRECYSSVFYISSFYTISLGTWYYLKIEKASTSLTLKIYSDSARTNLLTTLSLTLHGDWKFRYVFPCNTFNSNTACGCEVDIENLDLQPCYYVTFYNNSGGIFRVDNATISNGTEIEYKSGTLIELASLPQNSSYVFSRFTWDNENSTTNPCNYTVTSNMTIWCYFSARAGNPMPGVIIVFLILIPVCLVILLILKKR